MTDSIIGKAKHILGYIPIGLDTAKNWNEQNFDYYFKYFVDPNQEIRKYSLLVFAAGLENWIIESATIFTPYNEISPDYIFEDYIKSFISNKESIKTDFPALYNHMIISLLELNEQKKFNSIAGITSDTVLNDLQILLRETDKNSLKYLAFDEVLAEISEKENLK